MATSQNSLPENGAFENFIRSLESTSDDWVRDDGKIGKKGRQQKMAKSRNGLKDSVKLYQDMEKCYFDRKAIDLKCREATIRTVLEEQ